jgi:hypothetical protein
MHILINDKVNGFQIANENYNNDLIIDSVNIQINSPEKLADSILNGKCL